MAYDRVTMTSGATTWEFRPSNLQLVQHEYNPYHVTTISQTGVAKITELSSNQEELLHFQVVDLPYFATNAANSYPCGMFDYDSTYRGLLYFITTTIKFRYTTFTLQIPKPNLLASSWYFNGTVRYWEGMESLQNSITSEKFNGELVFRKEIT